jgi:hypothetical protein
MNESSLSCGEKRFWKQNPRWPHCTTSCRQTEEVSFLLLDCIHLCGAVLVENKGANLDYAAGSSLGGKMKKCNVGRNEGA